MSDQVVVPKLLSRAPTMWLSLGVTVVGVLAVVGYFATQPDTRVAAVVVGVLALVGIAVVLSRRVVVDRADGTVTSETLWVLKRSAGWGEVKVVKTPAGQTLLSVGAAKIALAADDMGGKRQQPAEVLEMLADQVEQWAPEKVSVARELRERAAGRPPGRSRR